MQKKHFLRSLSLAAFVTLAGCSVPGVYKVDIQQGNVITQDMINQLRPGMTEQQVRFIMGTSLISDTFNPRRWDYLYSMEPGRQERRQERISLFFNEQGLLTGLQGDFMPGISRDQAILGSPDEPEVTAYPDTDINVEEEL